MSLERTQHRLCNGVGCLESKELVGPREEIRLALHAVAHAGERELPGHHGKLLFDPRKLDRVFSQWRARRRAVEARYGLLSSDPVLLAPPDVFYPTWDRMQAGTFRQRCAKGRPHRDRLNATTYRQVCERLRREHFEPTVPASGSYTNHQWAHTWISGAEKVSLRQTEKLKLLRADEDGSRSVR